MYIHSERVGFCDTLVTVKLFCTINYEILLLRAPILATSVNKTERCSHNFATIQRLAGYTPFQPSSGISKNSPVNIGFMRVYVLIIYGCDIIVFRCGCILS